jgi:hypothetical protein
VHPFVQHCAVRVYAAAGPEGCHLRAQNQWYSRRPSRGRQRERIPVTPTLEMRIGAERVLAVLEDPCGAIEPFGRRELEMYRLAGERAKTGGDEQEPGEQLRAPTRTEGINLRGVFSFPIEQYAEQLAPVTHGSEIRACRSLVGAKKRAAKYAFRNEQNT